MREITAKTASTHWGQVREIDMKFLLERWDHFTMLNFIFCYLNYFGFTWTIWFTFTLLRSSDGWLLVWIRVRTVQWLTSDWVIIPNGVRLIAKRKPWLRWIWIGWFAAKSFRMIWSLFLIGSLCLTLVFSRRAFRDSRVNKRFGCLLIQKVRHLHPVCQVILTRSRFDAKNIFLINLFKIALLFLPFGWSLIPLTLRSNNLAWLIIVTKLLFKRWNLAVK